MRSALTDTTLSSAEHEVVQRFIGALRDRLSEGLRSVWLFGSRARGEEPGPGSDVDLLIVSDGGSKLDGRLVDEVLWDTASRAGLDPFRFTVVVWDPNRLAGRRAIRSFFIQEVDRDKVVLYGDP